MHLYFYPGACSLAVHIVLREAGVGYTLDRVDFSTGRTAAGKDYRLLNPKLQVPVLELDNGSLLTEGPVIAQYIADQMAPTRLLPMAGTMARYRVMEWQNFISSELQARFGVLFAPDSEAAARRAAKAALRRRFECVDAQLRTRAHLTGEDFTVADALLFVVAGWAPRLELELTDLAHLQAFMGRVVQRPAVRAALRAEGLLDA